MVTGNPYKRGVRHYREDSPAPDASLATRVAPASGGSAALRRVGHRGLIVCAFRLAGFMVWDLHSTSPTTIWAIFAGWCIGVLGASIAR